MTTDPKQPIYDALNQMGGAMPGVVPDDSQLIIDAYAEVFKLSDRDTQKVFVELIDRLKIRDASITRMIAGWEKATQNLRESRRLIEEMQKEKKKC